MLSSSLFKYMEQKRSNLCVGLDPRPPKGEEHRFNKLEFMLEIIEQTAEFAAAFKVNRQFVLDLSLSEMQTLVQAIKKHEAYAIIDHKLSDIGSTNEATFRYVAQEGFDAITVSPFAGNFDDNLRYSSSFGIELIYLALMSNPQSKWIKVATYNSKPVYQWFATQYRDKTHGVVIGTTGHISSEDIQALSSLLPPSTFVLAPGIGAQGGSPKLLSEAFPNRVLFSSSRSITQSPSPREAARSLLRTLTS